VASTKLNVGVPQLSVAVGVTQFGVAEHSIVEGPGKPLITGGVVSSTVMVCTAVAVLPHPSFAVQVRVKVYEPGQEPAMVASTKVKVGVAQLSVAVGLPQAGVPSHSMDDGPGTPEIVGGMVSSTLITCVAVAVLPQPSSAIQVRVIVYSFGQEPFTVASENVSVGVLQLSVAVAVAKFGVPEHSMVEGPGRPPITGGVVSSIVNNCEAVAVFPQSSVAVHVRVMVYSLGHDPLVVTSAKVKAGVLQLSVAVGVTQFGVPEHSAVDGPGKPLMTGGVVSSTVMVCTAVAVFPQSSVAVQVRVIVYPSGHAPAMVASTKLNEGVAQLSVAVGVAQLGVAEHSIVDGPGRPLITGGVVSSTVIT
jgi:hypothetical protein